MRFTVNILFFLLIVGSIAVYSQDKDTTVIYFDSEYNFTKITYKDDSTSAVFKIFLKGMEIEKERRDAIKRHREKGLPFPMFYFTFIANEPQKICSLISIDYITAIEFRENQYRPSNSFIIIQELKNDGYLKWDAIFIPYL